MIAVSSARHAVILKAALDDVSCVRGSYSMFNNETMVVVQLLVLLHNGL